MFCISNNDNGRGIEPEGERECERKQRARGLERGRDGDTPACTHTRQGDRKEIQERRLRGQRQS